MQQLKRVLTGMMVACLVAMVLMVFGNVVLRYALNSGITLSEELSRWLFVWMTFLGSVLALVERGHLGTDSLVSRLGPRGRRWCAVLSWALVWWVCALLLWGAWRQTEINWGSSSAVMEIPMAFLYGSGVLFAALGLVIVSGLLWRSLRDPHAALPGFVTSEDEAPSHSAP